jgi:hypothetical protein
VTRFLSVEQVAQRYCSSVRWAQAQAAAGKLPHRRLGGCRRLLFSELELEQFEAGAELERIALAGGGRHVRPVVNTTTGRRGSAPTTAR